MSIADKINSIRTHLETDYEALENIGAELENVDKNIENIASVVNGIYDNLPKTTGEDTSLSLTTLKGKMNIIPKGDTEQTQYSGYNLYNANVASKTENGLTITNMGNGIYKVNGTATADLSTALNDEFMQVSGTFRVSGCPSGGSSSTYMLSAYVGYWGGGSPNIDTGSGTNITYTGNFKLRLYIKSGTTCNNLIFKPMVTTDLTKNYADYEPYVGGTASPNPSYPQNIEVVTGTQEVKVENKNLLEGIELGDINSQTGAESTSTSVLRGTNYIRYFTNTDYFPSVNGNLIASGSVINLRFYNKDKQYIGYATLLRTGGRNFNITITTSVVDTTPYYFRIRTTTSVAKTTDNVMISYSSDTTYVEHQEQTQIVSLGDIELCKIGNYQDYLYKTSGKQLFNKDDSSLIFNGFPNASTNTLQTNNNARTICLPCKPNTTYTISKVLSQRFLKAETSSDTIQANIEVSNLYGNASLTEQHITTGANAKYILIFYYLSTADTLSEETIRNSIMINYGSTALPYEPYGSGKWYKKEYIGKQIFTGASSEYWNTSGTSTSGYNRFTSALLYNLILKPTATSQVANIMSNYFIKKSADNTYAKIEGISVGTNGNLYIYADSLKEYTKEQFTTWLSTHNTEVYYVLTTANDIEITDTTLIQQLDNLEKLMSYNGTTNISSSGNLSAILGVSALKGE